MPNNIMIAGCGNIGLKLAQALSSHYEVYGLKRNASLLPPEIKGISADVTDPASLEGKLPSSIDYVVYCLTAGTFNDEAYRQIYVDGLTNLINELKQSSISPKRLFFVSSSSVYHQDDDQWVNEDSPVEPSGFSGKRLLEAEQVALDSGIPATNVRFSGIYGGHRTRLLQQVKNGSANANSQAYTNRIHEDDCVRVLKHLIEQDISGKNVEACYLASDSEPVRMKDLISWMTKELNISASSENKPASKGKRRAGSKQCSNKRLIDSGFEFKYPTYREGYGEMIARIKKEEA
ncbi:NAD-dependent epimerase/dehydratase family protein [Alkalimarinus coralli]|nr:NAD-dependent epimerase/dehydratase family protein [Alkalimarinus coralli]